MVTPKKTDLEVQRNMLDGKQKYRLAQWLDSQRDRIERMSLTAPVLAKEATEQLKFTVSPGNIYGACQTLDYRLPQGAKRQATIENGKVATEQLARLPQTLTDLLARVERIEKELGLAPLES